MSKGKMISAFKVGDRVEFLTNDQTKVFNKEINAKTNKVEKVFSHNVPNPFYNIGTIVKLHKSGRSGAAEIRPDQGLGLLSSKKVARRLQFVKKVSAA